MRSSLANVVLVNVNSAKRAPSPHVRSEIPATIASVLISSNPVLARVR